MPKYYWAYGSNLNIDHMRRRCPGAEPVCALPVSDGRLIFRHVADIVSARGEVVQGGLWRVTPDCVRSLDVYEGVASGLYRRMSFPIEVRGKVHDCLLYQMTARGIMPPSQVYLDTIIQGYEDFGLDLSYLDAAVARSWDDKNKTRDMREQYLRRGRKPLARLSAS